jgi:hypothetical protein
VRLAFRGSGPAAPVGFSSNDFFTVETHTRTVGRASQGGSREGAPFLALNKTVVTMVGAIKE